MPGGYVIFGLGNPGEEYENSRHNAGFMVLDAMARRLGCPWRRTDRPYVLAEGAWGPASIFLVKPLTYVNRSGRAVEDLLSRGLLEDRTLIVVADDFALPLGRLRLRPRGSDGGHNGMKSVIRSLGTTEFPRLRVGVGPRPEGVDPAAFVLAPLDQEEARLLERSVAAAADCLRMAVEKGLEEAMSRFNGLDLAEGEPP